MVETLERIFKLLKLPRLLGYSITLFLLALSTMGTIYLKERFQNSFKTNRLVKERLYLEKKDNEKEIRKVLAEIKTELTIYVDLPNPLGSTIVPKVNFDLLTEKLNQVINNNTYCFSSKLCTSLVQIRHLLNSLKQSDEILLSSISDIDSQDIETFRRIAKNIEMKFMETYFPLEENVLTELNNIGY